MFSVFSSIIESSWKMSPDLQSLLKYKIHGGWLTVWHWMRWIARSLFPREEAVSAGGTLCCPSPDFSNNQPPVAQKKWIFQTKQENRLITTRCAKKWIFKTKQENRLKFCQKKEKLDCLIFHFFWQCCLPSRPRGSDWVQPFQWDTKCNLTVAPHRYVLCNILRFIVTMNADMNTNCQKGQNQPIWRNDS